MKFRHLFVSLSFVLLLMAARFAAAQTSASAQPGEAAAPAAGVEARVASVLPDSPALATAKTALLPFVAAKDFEARVDKVAAGLSPAEVAAIDEYFAPLIEASALRNGLLSEAAALRLLLGDFESAARDSEASASIDGTIPTATSVATRLRAARLWLAAGEADKASQIAAVIITSSKDAFEIDEARLVAAWASLLSGSQASALALADGIAARGADSISGPTSKALSERRDALRREAVFILWAGGDAKARDIAAKRLALDWPGSPEALIAADSSTISLMALPHWYLGGIAIGGIAPGPAELPADSAATEAGGAKVADSSPISAGKGASPSPLAAQPLRYQVGVFSNRVNAQALVDELRKKGYIAKIESRQVGSQALLAVVLSQADNKDKLVERLKDAGYEAWLLND